MEINLAMSLVSEAMRRKRVSLNLYSDTSITVKKEVKNWANCKVAHFQVMCGSHYRKLEQILFAYSCNPMFQNKKRLLHQTQFDWHGFTVGLPYLATKVAGKSWCKIAVSNVVIFTHWAQGIANFPSFLRILVESSPVRIERTGHQMQLRRLVCAGVAVGQGATQEFFLR